jgi:4-hydroxy-tetrahydrodipicolinate synthase
MATAAALLGLAGEHNLPRPLRGLDGDARRELDAVLRTLQLSG